MATRQDFDMDQGAQWEQNLLWTDENDVPTDLTGYTARMQVRRQKRSSSFLIELTTSNGRITLGGTAGTIQLEVDAVATAALPGRNIKQRWFYDLEMVPAGGEVRRLIEGRIVFSSEVTR